MNQSTKDFESICFDCGSNSNELMVIEKGIALCPNCKRKESIENNSIKKWIVLWKRNERLGSFELNESNWEIIKRKFIYNTIQTDVTGTVHIEIFGIKNKA